jgi:hypothetical protein
MQVLDLPVARREQHAFEQRRSDAAALPRRSTLIAASASPVRASRRNSAAPRNTPSTKNP